MVNHFLHTTELDFISTVQKQAKREGKRLTTYWQRGYDGEKIQISISYIVDGWDIEEVYEYKKKDMLAFTKYTQDNLVTVHRHRLEEQA